MIDLTSTVRGDLIVEIERLEAERISLAEALRIVTPDRNTIAATLDGAQGRESALKVKNDALLAAASKSEEESGLPRFATLLDVIAILGIPIVPSAREDAVQLAKRVAVNHARAFEDVDQIVKLVEPKDGAVVSAVARLVASSKEARHLLGAAEGESLEAAAERVVKGRDEAIRRAGPGVPAHLENIRQALGARDDKKDIDAARRVVAERDALKEEIDEALLAMGAAGRDLVKAASHLRAQFDDIRKKHNAVVEALYSEPGETPADAVKGIKEARTRALAGLALAQTEIGELKVALSTLRETHDATARRDADTRNDAAIVGAQVEVRDATIRKLERELLELQLAARAASSEYLDRTDGCAQLRLANLLKVVPRPRSETSTGGVA